MQKPIIDAKVCECSGNQWFVCVNIYRGGVRNDNPEQHTATRKTLQGAVNFARGFKPQNVKLELVDKDETPWYIADRKAGYKFND